jgi:hypothetical protein
MTNGTNDSANRQNAQLPRWSFSRSNGRLRELVSETEETMRGFACRENETPGTATEDGRRKTEDGRL